ncbi:MAG: lipopolysaccharide heptosyltransferase II [Gammaproteobacteria bacterium]|nr:lipopolysaccharide heptosyltransferase II [Gammaproteobacteria bacterium]
MKNIAVIGLKRIGDAIYTLQTFEALKRSYPEAKIIVFTESQVANIYEGNPFIDQIVSLSKKQFWKTTLQELKQGHYDLCIVNHNAFKYALLPFLAKVPMRIGFNKEARSFLLTHSRDLPTGVTHRLEHNALILDLIGLESRDLLPRIYLTEQDDLAVSKLFQTFGLKDAQYICFIVGSIAATRRWFPENFARVIDLISEKYGLKCVILGGPDDVEIAELVSSKVSCAESVLNLAGKTTLRGTMQLFSKSVAVISNDTGPMHVASALGCQVVTWFGAANELEIAPPSASTTILNTHVSCGPCVKETCPTGTLKCLHEITPEMVVSTLKC